MKNCNQCGKCCIKYGNGALSASENEIEMWRLFRPDIYLYVNKGQIWADPNSGLPLTRCPFLIANTTSNTDLKYSCGIYHDRPEDCRHYPSEIEEMIRDECEMIESIDLTHIERAQRKLDGLMADSRPAKG